MAARVGTKARKSGGKPRASTAKRAAAAARRTPAPAKRTRRRAASGSPRGAAKAAAPDLASLARQAKLLTPEQAIALYKANARMALDVINAALESSARVQKLSLAGVDEVRAFGERQARNVAAARTPDAVVAAGQVAARDAIEHAMGYWSQMFDLIVEIQKRLFTLIEAQVGDVPGVKEARAAMAMMPDMSQAQNVIRALQGVVSSSSGAVESMQKVIADLARMGGLRRV
jgi:hypothetical protein